MPRGPFVPIPDTVKIELIGHDIGDNRPNVQVMHCRASSAPNATEVSAYVAVFEAWLATVSAHTSGEIQWDLVRGTDLNSATGPQENLPTVHGGSGGDAPPGLSAVVEMFTALRGRSFTGRTFWPPDWAAVTMANGQLTGAGQTALETAFGTLQTNLGVLSPTSYLVVASRKLHTGTQVTGFHCRPEIGRIRRRAFG
jgi:hypothetical protein